MRASEKKPRRLMVTSLISSACSLTRRIDIGSLCGIDSCPKETRFQSERSHHPCASTGQTGPPQAWGGRESAARSRLSAYHRCVLETQPVCGGNHSYFRRGPGGGPGGWPLGSP